MNTTKIRQSTTQQNKDRIVNPSYLKKLNMYQTTTKGKTCPAEVHSVGGKSNVPRSSIITT